MAAGHVTAALARRAYALAVRLHPDARGYAPQMLATFDELLGAASSQGRIAMLRLLVRETAGLARSRSDAAGAGSPRPRRAATWSILRDVRFALRTFRRRPSFTASVVVTLALGIGFNAAVFSVTEAVLFERLPFPDPARLVMVWRTRPLPGFRATHRRPATTRTGRRRCRTSTPWPRSIWRASTSLVAVTR